MESGFHPLPIDVLGPRQNIQRGIGHLRARTSNDPPPDGVVRYALRRGDSFQALASGLLGRGWNRALHRLSQPGFPEVDPFGEIDFADRGGRDFTHI